MQDKDLNVRVYKYEIINEYTVTGYGNAEQLVSIQGEFAERRTEKLLALGEEVGRLGKGRI